MDPTTVQFTVRELIGAWRRAIEDTVSLCTELTEEQWNARTRCPGWSVADVTAHAADIESFMLGMPRPDHTPAWDSLPHVTGSLGQFTETGVDARRGSSKSAVLEELRSVADRRLAELEALPDDAMVPGFSGRPSPLSRVLRTRTFDLWAHEQDIRAAIDAPGNLASQPAIVSFQQMAAALPLIWAGEVAAPTGAVAKVSVTGPALHADLFALVAADGTGAGSQTVADPTVQLTTSWPDYVQLSCGRADIETLRRSVTRIGDADLAESLLRSMCITP